MKTIFILALAVTLTSCAKMPEGQEPVLRPASGIDFNEMIQLDKTLQAPDVYSIKVQGKGGVTVQ